MSSRTLATAVTAERDLYDFAGDGDLSAGQRRIDLLRQCVPNQSELQRDIAVFKNEWRRWPRVDEPDLFAQHLRGELALGGIYKRKTRVFVIDIDRHGDCDERDLSLRRTLAEEVLPTGILFRSSSSGGLHLRAWLDQEVPIDQLIAAFAPRVRKAARRMPELLKLYPDLCHFEGAGIPGVFELHPRPSSGKGSTLRAPFGRGFALITDHGYVTDAVYAMQLVEEHLAVHGRTRVVDILGRRPVQFVLPGQRSRAIVGVEVPRPAGPLRPPRRREHNPHTADLSDVISSVSQPGLTRLLASHSHYRAAFRRIRTEPPPPGRRNDASFPLGLSYRWDGYTHEKAREEAAIWFRDIAYRTSRDNPDGALARTLSAIDHVYRPDAPKPRVRKRYRRPVAVSLREIEWLCRILPNEPGLRMLGAIVIGHARANGWHGPNGVLVFDLPLYLLGRWSRRLVRNLELLERYGIIRRIRGVMSYQVGPGDWRKLPVRYTLPRTPTLPAAPGAGPMDAAGPVDGGERMPPPTSPLDAPNGGAPTAPTGQADEFVLDRPCAHPIPDTRIQGGSACVDRDEVGRQGLLLLFPRPREALEEGD